MTPLNQILQIREQCINIYKRYERFIVPLLKFLFIISVLLMINNTLGYAPVLTKTTVILMIGLAGVFLSPQMIMMLFIFMISFHIGAQSLEAGAIVFTLLLMIYLLFVRLYPKESLFIIGMIIAYKFKIPYIIPLVAGLFSSLPTMIAVGIGTMIWYSAPQLAVMMQAQASELSDIVEVINANIAILQEILKSDQTMLASIIILSAVLLTVYLIRKQAVDFAEYIAIFVGAVMNVIGFLFAILLLKAEVGIGSLIFSTIVCGFLAVIAQFFSKAADYSRAEIVQFEDEENYYYVKVVPKIIVNKPKKQVKRIYTRDEMRYNE